MLRNIILFLMLLTITVVLLSGCSTKNNYKEEPKLTAMEKFFDCLGDSSKCKDIKNSDN